MALLSFNGLIIQFVILLNIFYIVCAMLLTILNNKPSKKEFEFAVEILTFIVNSN